MGGDTRFNVDSKSIVSEQDLSIWDSQPAALLPLGCSSAALPPL
jgi:hypothetical protein